MMTSQILKSVDFTKTHKSRYLENETWFFLQIKKIIIINTSRATLLQNIVGSFSCDVCDSQKGIFLGGKLSPNLDFKEQKWKIMLNLLSTTFKKKKNKRVKCNVFNMMIVAI